MQAPFRLDTADPTPLYAQIERGIRSAIATGRLPVGDQLPTVRAMAVELRVNANTVAKVYAELERAGVLETRRGVGTFVREAPRAELSAAAHERELRALADRVLAEIAVRGITLDELLQHLVRRQRQEDGDHGEHH